MINSANWRLHRRKSSVQKSFDKYHFVIYLYCGSAAISVIQKASKNNVSQKNLNGFRKRKGWRFDFRGLFLFWQKGCRLYYVISKCWFDCSKSCMSQGCKKPIHMVCMGPPYSSPWVCRVQLRTLLEKVVDLRALQFWSIQTLAFLTFTDLY